VGDLPRGKFFFGVLVGDGKVGSVDIISKKSSIMLKRNR
jgi:hypothetical protein